MTNYELFLHLAKGNDHSWVSAGFVYASKNFWNVREEGNIALPFREYQGILLRVDENVSEVMEKPEQEQIEESPTDSSVISTVPEQVEENMSEVGGHKGLMEIDAVQVEM